MCWTSFCAWAVRVLHFGRAEKGRVYSGTDPAITTAHVRGTACKREFSRADTPRLSQQEKTKQSLMRVFTRYKTKIKQT